MLEKEKYGLFFLYMHKQPCCQRGGMGGHMHNIRIETERLLLRPLTVADAEDMFEWVSDERVARYMVYTT